MSDNGKSKETVSLGAYLLAVLESIFASLGLIFVGWIRVTLFSLTVVGGLVIQWLAIDTWGFNSFFDLWSPTPIDNYSQYLLILAIAAVIFLFFQIFIETSPEKVKKTGEAFAFTGALANVCWFLIDFLLFFATST